MLDISLLRTANSLDSPPALASYVNEKLEGARKPMICRIADALGLTYVPQDVLKDEQITALVKGAVARETSKEKS